MAYHHNRLNIIMVIYFRNQPPEENHSFGVALFSSFLDSRYYYVMELYISVQIFFSVARKFMAVLNK